MQGRNRDADIKKGLVDSQEKERVGRIEMASEKLLCNTRRSTQRSVTTSRGGVARRFKREGIHVYLCLIHVAVRQKPTQHCKAIILQLKINFLKNVNFTMCITNWLFPTCILYKKLVTKLFS